MEQAREEGDPERKTPWDNMRPEPRAFLLWSSGGFLPFKSSDHICVQFMEVRKHLNQNTILKCWAIAQNLLSAQ